MAHTRGGHTDASLTWEPTSQAPKAASIPSSEGGVPSSPHQRRYETRRSPTTPGVTYSCPESSARRTSAKRARTSGLGESSRPSHPNSRPLQILRYLLACHRKPSSKGPWSPCRPLRAIKIIEPNRFSQSFTLISRSCTSSQSFGIHLVYSRGTIWSTSWPPRSFSIPNERWTSINPWLPETSGVLLPSILTLMDARLF